MIWCINYYIVKNYKDDTKRCNKKKLKKKVVLKLYLNV